MRMPRSVIWGLSGSTMFFHNILLKAEFSEKVIQHTGQGAFDGQFSIIDKNKGMFCVET